METNLLFPETAATAATATEPKMRSKRTDAEKLSIIAEHLRGDNIDTVQRRHGLGHSTLKKWMSAFGIEPLDGTSARLTTSLARDNARLSDKLTILEGLVAELKAENAQLRGKIRAARTALVLTSAPRTEEEDEPLEAELAPVA